MWKTITRHWRTVAAATALTALAACDGGNAVGETLAALPKASTGISSTTAALTAVAQTGPVAMVDKLFVSDVQNVVEGKTDYVLSSINCNKTGILYNQKGVLSSTDGTVQIVQDTLSFGGSSFNQCQLSSTKAVVRAANGQALDLNKLNLTMSADQQALVNPIKLIKVDFYRQGGRPGHGGNLALNSQYPIQNEVTELKVNLDGVDLKVNFEIFNQKGQGVLKGSLEKSPDVNTMYSSVVSIPTDPFLIVINAIDTNGNKLLTSTELYKPSEKPLDLVIENAVVKSTNQVIPVRIIGTAPTTGKFVFKIHLPTGFSSEIEDQTSEVAAGQNISIAFNITSPAVAIIGKQPLYLQYKFLDREEVLISKKFLAINTGV